MAINHKPELANAATQASLDSYQKAMVVAVGGGGGTVSNSSLTGAIDPRMIAPAKVWYDEYAGMKQRHFTEFDFKVQVVNNGYVVHASRDMLMPGAKPDAFVCKTLEEVTEAVQQFIVINELDKDGGQK